jgi:hypothetical protein
MYKSTRKNRKQQKKTRKYRHKGGNNTNNKPKKNNSVTEKPTVEIGTNYASRLNALENDWTKEQRNLESANRKGYNTVVREHKVRQENIAEEHEALNAERRKLYTERQNRLPDLNTLNGNLIDRYQNYILRGRRQSMFDLDKNE